MIGKTPIGSRRNDRIMAEVRRVLDGAREARTSRSVEYISII